MYRKTDERQMEFPGFYMPFSGQLDTENRWITLVKLVPWELVAEIYHATLFEDEGAPIISARVAIGALIIKEHQGLTDRETVKAIQENPYMQYFIGFEEFTNERPFDASLMVDFRKRFGEDGTLKINEAIMLASLQMSEHVDNNLDNADDISTPASESAHGTSPDDVAKSPENRGKLIVDATCTPADIRYPTDVSLLNEAREKMDKVIDELHKPLSGKQRHPRTYREIARRKFVAFTKKKKPGHKAVRKAIREQLGYLKRNLAAIDRLVETPGALPLARLSWQMYKNLLVCRELYRQQLEMYENNTRRIDDRIVSISQPHVRPIKRGKARNDTEFGAKISISVVEGFSCPDHISWDNYNESLDLVEQIELYRRRFGYYPESVHADRIYRNRANRAFCKTHGIRMSGPALGRPKQLSCAEKKQALADEAVRNQVEGKFGQGKRRFGLGLIMTKLACTSVAQISLSFLVMNLELALRRLFFCIIFWYQCFDRERFVMQSVRVSWLSEKRLAI